MAQISLIRLVKIEASFGSDIQHDVCMKILREFLEAWKMNVESAHKKNRITIEYGGSINQIDPGRRQGGVDDVWVFG